MKQDETVHATRGPAKAFCTGSPAMPGAESGNPMALCGQMAGRMAVGMLRTVLVVLLVLASLWVGFSHLEARSFERVAGIQVSTWDAMFIELRVHQPTE